MWAFCVVVTGSAASSTQTHRYPSFRPTYILTTMAIAFPFSAIVGQDEMKLAILIAAVDPAIGGILVFGDRGTGK